ncbi:isochorismate synthase [Parenemella sanctibonifatiensis]|uniref:isochorismate synthase n=1 Tax=Parenemella sanctibonifatiensis TaxID=2016505 RepID=A0A255EBM0_9ACTN|nr:isochorismate synthase [Parenemella sanctibonifatiensis]OYN88958.1 isochorismate synthase [Parenemella sanctibonifatiensis]
MSLHPTASRWRARTVAIDDPGPLEDLLPERNALAWIREGEGVVGLGEVARFTPGSIGEADQWWQEFCGTLEFESEMPGESGTGPLAFCSFSFDVMNTTRPSVMVVPEVIIGRRNGVTWMTRLGLDDFDDTPPEAQDPPTRPSQVSYRDGSLSPLEWAGIVKDAVARISQGDVEKVVLARDLVATTAEPLDLRWLVRQLAPAYRRCWTFLVDGLVGASPELLIRRSGGLATSRVLAGTIGRPASSDTEALAAKLTQSQKELDEHRLAAESAARALAPHCLGMHVPDQPFVLALPNVLHLASDIAAVADPNTSALQLAEALHPTAAVCGAPTDEAREIIRDLEGMDRGRYAGPVGWIDAQGDGEFAIALRCGQAESDRELRLYAGCGIMRDSDPQAELIEADAKFLPMRDALEATALPESSQPIPAPQT